MPVRWTHITIAVSDMERSLAFYQTFCGLQVLRDRRLEGGNTVWLGPTPPSGEQPLYVLVLMQGKVESKMDHLGFQCDSRSEVDRIAEQAASLDILEIAPTDSGGVVGYWTMLRDPDGHHVEFTYGQPITGLR